MRSIASCPRRGVPIKHNVAWVPNTGSYEDEYLVGLDNIIRMFQEQLDSQ